MKPKNGFTLIEMLVVVAVTAILAMVSVANFRAAEKRKRVALGVDSIIAAISLAQTYSQSGKATTNSDPSCRVAQYYYVRFTYTNSYTVHALNNCGGTDLIDTFTLPPLVRVQTAGLVMDSIAGVSSMQVAFYPPFAQVRGGLNVAANSTFNTAVVTLQSDDGSVIKAATIDGVVGRVR
jgi:prepilin-type N-terminal cleavage/methylation domain-containing protein